jgi:hypothetical protein
MAMVLVLIGGLALSVASPTVQVVVLLAALALVFLRLAPVGEAADAPAARTRDQTAVPKVTAPYSERFHDAKEAIKLVRRACAAFDANKAGELSAALDLCTEEYVRVLSGAQDSYSTHMQARDNVRRILEECYVTSDEGATAAIDGASARIENLFAACDTVLHRDGKADRPAPVPVAA